MISPNDKMIIETRNTDKKSVYYNCLDLFSGKKIFNGIQLDEKYWIGIEAVHDDIIFFHKFTKPDMPGHMQVIAFDIKTQKVIWQNENYSFLFVLEDKVYCYVQHFEGRKYIALNKNTGQFIEELQSEDEIEKLNNIYEDSKDYSDYIFPEKFDAGLAADEKVKSIIAKQIGNAEVIGSVEYALYQKILIMNYYSKIIGNSLLNKLTAYDIDSGKELFIEILNADANAYVPDAFFIYKNMVIMLKEKSNVIVCELA